MSTLLLDSFLIESAFSALDEEQESPLATATAELADLRFSIIVTARWEASASGDAARRNALHSTLKGLRFQYSQKIDEVAMRFGVQRAMDAKDEVECTVTVPQGLDMERLAPARDDESLYF
jgi:hypothetical protein